MEGGIAKCILRAKGGMPRQVPFIGNLRSGRWG